MNRLFNNLLGRKEVQSKSNVPTDSPSTSINVGDMEKTELSSSSPKLQEESLEALEAEQQRIQDMVNNMKKQLSEMEDNLVSLNTRIQRYKMSFASCQQPYKEDNIELKVTQEKMPPISDSEDDETDAPPVILPKPLTIKGYDDVNNVIWRHVQDVLPESYSDKYKYYQSTLYNIARSLSIVGKEVVLEKISRNEDETKLKEWREIIETCRKIVEYKNKNDMMGYNKLLTFFYQKYPQPANPFKGECVTDFYAQANSIYTDSFHIFFFLRMFRNELSNYNKQYISDWEKSFFVEKIKIDDKFIKLLELLYTLSIRGMKLSIVPIFDENIIYRPKRVAKDGKYFSFYYYDDYVEKPHMVTDDEAKSSTPTYYTYGGSTYVSGHYRSGYWRNGRWVSGGYVKGHYRS